MKTRVLVPMVLCAVSLLFSCGTTRSVERVASDSTIDLSGRWNDVDSRRIATTMVEDLLRRAWIDDFRDENDRKPVVIVGTIRNRSSEHIDASIFIKDIERELINAGKVKFVANDRERDALRNERNDQQSESAMETAKRLGRETGADFMLQGQITSQTDQVEGRKVVSYKVDLELINIETNEKAWIGSESIKKDISQARVKF